MLDIIQSLWIGDSLSVMERLSLSSFLKNGHEVHLYTYGGVKGVPAGVVVKDAAEIVPMSLSTITNFPSYVSLPTCSVTSFYMTGADGGLTWI